ncbi:hypothetical protein, partial [Pseudomonas aeruginosa]|uniref:hypothetical protein n=1 Tax=Pseudomonas aeruginosa TaxID=287 RepID=UPI0013CE2B4B
MADANARYRLCYTFSEAFTGTDRAMTIAWKSRFVGIRVSGNDFLIDITEALHYRAIIEKTIQDVFSVSYTHLTLP